MAGLEIWDEGLQDGKCQPEGFQDGKWQPYLVQVIEELEDGEDAGPDEQPHLATNVTCRNSTMRAPSTAGPLDPQKLGGISLRAADLQWHQQHPRNGLARQNGFPANGA